MAEFREYPPAVEGIKTWLRTLSEDGLDKVIQELRIGAATLALAQSIRSQRALDAYLAEIVDVAFPEVDSVRFVEALRATTRARHQLGLELDPITVLEAATEVSSHPQHPRSEEDQ